MLELIGDTKKEMLEDFRAKLPGMTIEQLEKHWKDYSTLSRGGGSFSGLWDTIAYECGKRLRMLRAERESWNSQSKQASS